MLWYPWRGAHVKEGTPPSNRVSRRGPRRMGCARGVRQQPPLGARACKNQLARDSAGGGDGVDRLPWYEHYTQVISQARVLRAFVDVAMPINDAGDDPSKDPT